MNDWTKEDIQKFGFIYEPDVTKCKFLKLRLGIPEIFTEDYKLKIAEQIPYIYVNQIKETPNPYEGNPNFLADPKIVVAGHTKIYD
jgi:hypothetical protein